MWGFYIVVKHISKMLPSHKSDFLHCGFQFVHDATGSFLLTCWQSFSSFPIGRLMLCVPCPRWWICSTARFRTGSCSPAATWCGTWAARTATANWAGSMSLPPRTASATRRAAWSWREPWSGRARASRSTFHLTIPEEAPVSSQVLCNWNSNVIKSTKKICLHTLSP